MTIKQTQSKCFLKVMTILITLLGSPAKANLRFLSSLTHFYVYGTFNNCPKYFLQLITVHGLKNVHYIPLVDDRIFLV